MPRYAKSTKVYDKLGKPKFRNIRAFNSKKRENNKKKKKTKLDLVIEPTFQPEKIDSFDDRFACRF